MNFKLGLSFTFILFLLGTLIPEMVQACQSLERVYSSQALGRDENYLLILPNPGVPIDGAVYYLHGNGGSRYTIRDLGACAQVDRLASAHGKSMIVVGPDGGTGYWMNGAHTTERYRDLVAQELIAQVEAEFVDLVRAPAKRVLAGNSMGGAGAIQISINDPGIFGAIGAHSPVFRTQVEATAEFPNQFGTGVDYQSRDPFSLILIQHKPFSGPVYIDMGGEDPWISNTRNFQALMQSLHIDGVYQVGDDVVGGHADGYWQYHLQSYFDWYFQMLERTP